METLVKNKREYTYKDYQLTPEGAEYELINGQIVHEPDAPFITHQRILRKLLVILDIEITKNNMGEIFCSPCDVFFDDKNVLQPDLVFVSEERKKIIGNKLIKGTPDLVIEIISQHNISKDTLKKKDIYEKFGVREYWIVHPKEQMVEVFVLENSQYILNNVYTKEVKLKSNVLRDFQLELKEIF